MGKMCWVTDKREKHTSPFFESSQGFMRALEIYQNFMRDIKPSWASTRICQSLWEFRGQKRDFAKLFGHETQYETRVTSKSETFKKTNVYSLLGGMRKCSKNQSCHIPWNFNNTNFLLSLGFVLSNKWEILWNLLFRENIGNTVTALFLKIVVSTLTLTAAFRSTNQTKTFPCFWYLTFPKLLKNSLFYSFYQVTPP